MRCVLSLLTALPLSLLRACVRHSLIKIKEDTQALGTGTGMNVRTYEQALASVVRVLADTALPLL